MANPHFSHHLGEYFDKFKGIFQKQIQDAREFGGYLGIRDPISLKLNLSPPGDGSNVSRSFQWWGMDWISRFRRGSHEFKFFGEVKQYWKYIHELMMRWCSCSFSCRLLKTIFSMVFPCLFWSEAEKEEELHVRGNLGSDHFHPWKVKKWRMISLSWLLGNS